MIFSFGDNTVYCTQDPIKVPLCFLNSVKNAREMLKCLYERSNYLYCLGCLENTTL
jgi:hypothetical protein